MKRIPTPVRRVWKTPLCSFRPRLTSGSSCLEVRLFFANEVSKRDTIDSVDAPFVAKHSIDFGAFAHIPEYISW